MDGPGETERPLLMDVLWKRDYRTTARDAADILDDFYVPLLERARTYDRVAGYFRSSSIQVALKGFGAFVRAGGTARFIVGADMRSEDVSILMAGQDDLLVRKLDCEIDAILSSRTKEAMPSSFELLAWMVWKGALRIRIAVVERVASEEHRFDARDFSYAHEKWAVVTDAEGRRLGFAGSLNESRTALQNNAENVSVFCDWLGDDPSSRIDDMASDFDHLWEGRHEIVKVVDVPVAVERRLLKIGEAVDVILRRSRRPADIQVDELEQEVWRRLVLAPRTPEGRFLGLTTGPVHPWPHQEFVSRRIVETYPRSFIVADEVGLGKTIEIGGAIRELILSGKASRVLIVAPATLTRQWQSEMREKFLLEFLRCEGKRHMLPDDDGKRAAQFAPTFQPDLLVLSAQTFAKDDVQRKFLHGEDWDLIVLDEAHYATNSEDEPDPSPEDPAWNLKRGDTKLRLAFRRNATRKTPAIILATATPMQVRRKQAYDLMRLTGLAGSYLMSDGTSDAFYEAVMRIRQATVPREDDEILVRTFVKEVRDLDPDHFEFVLGFYAGRSRQDFLDWIDGVKTFTRVANMTQKRRRITVALHAMAPLSRVMLRHGRDLLKEYRKHGLLSAGLADRHVAVSSVSMTPAETDAYESLEAYCETLKKILDRHHDKASGRRAGNQTNFFLSFLRLRFASSVFAAWETVKRRRARVALSINWLDRTGSHRTPMLDVSDAEENDYGVEDQEDDSEIEVPLPNRSVGDLREELKLLDNVVGCLDLLDPDNGMSSKDRRLLEQLDPRHNPAANTQKQTIVFTRFGDTMRHLVRQLRRTAPSVSIATYSGQGGEFFDVGAETGQRISRKEVTNHFVDGRANLLVCTDAAAEGLNLQVADMLVNFDLPWNPAKVEQRIGRIDRIGQFHKDIYVVNMAYDGSAELEVYGRLLDRVEQATMIIGTQQIALLPIGPEQFAELAARSITDAKREEILETARARAEEVARAYKQREMDVADLAEVHKELQAAWRADSEWTVDRAWDALTTSAFLLRHGSGFEDDVFLVPPISGVVKHEIRFTRDRARYEKGGVSFSTWGDPLFDSLAFDLAGMTGNEGVSPVAREAAIHAARDRSLNHWRFAQAHRRFLSDTIIQFTRYLDASASPATKKAEIAGRLGNHKIKQVRPLGVYGMASPSLARYSHDSEKVIIPRCIIEIAVEEVL